jgi:hypothetical protein
MIDPFELRRRILAAAQGFLDEDDSPPWDTWLGLDVLDVSRGPVLLSWVPRDLTRDARQPGTPRRVPPSDRIGLAQENPAQSSSKKTRPTSRRSASTIYDRPSAPGRGAPASRTSGSPSAYWARAHGRHDQPLRPRRRRSATSNTNPSQTCRRDPRTRRKSSPVGHGVGHSSKEIRSRREWLSS